ncbi:MAG: hypothetical protein AAGD13_02485 [Pseudomonadota bacterium]
MQHDDLRRVTQRGAMRGNNPTDSDVRRTLQKSRGEAICRAACRNELA